MMRRRKKKKTKRKKNSKKNPDLVYATGSPPSFRLRLLNPEPEAMDLDMSKPFGKRQQRTLPTPSSNLYLADSRQVNLPAAAPMETPL